MWFKDQVHFWLSNHSKLFNYWIMMHYFVAVISLICQWMIQTYVCLQFFNILIDILNPLPGSDFVESTPKHYWFPKPPINLPDLYGTHLNIISLFVTICPIVWISIIISNSLLLGLNQPLLLHMVWMEMDSTSKYPLFVKVYFFRDNEC